MKTTRFGYVVGRCAVGVCGIIAFTVFLCSSVWAGELRVLDPHGLVRITREVKGESTIVLHLSTPFSGADLQLSNVNGLTPDVNGVAVDSTTIQFSTVPEGTWRVVVPEGAVAISNIEIR